MPKLMTYRLMAEMAADLACVKLGNSAKCKTHLTPLPGSESKTAGAKKYKELTGIPNSIIGSTMYRHGKRVFNILTKDPKSYGIVCECEMVTRGEIEYALENLEVKDLQDLRRRTRLGMGPCQGELCVMRAAGLMVQQGRITPDAARDMLVDFLEERWKGVRPVLWGDALRESEFTYWIYQGLFGLGSIKELEARQ